MNNLFADALLNAIPKLEDKDGYRDIDGILRCKTCMQPMEMRLNILGEERLVPIMCKCQKEKHDADEAARKAADRKSDSLLAISRLREVALAEMPRFTFSQNDGASERATKITTRYALKFDELYAQNVGMMLYGPTGSGKTFFAHCVAAELIDKGYFVWMTNIRTLAERMGDEEKRAMVIRNLHRADLVVIDDFGAERSTPYMVERCYDIINERYNAKKPLVITTNLDPSVMMQEQDLTYRRIYDRINGLCTPVLVDGKTRRKTEAVNKMIALKAILEE